LFERSKTNYIIASSLLKADMDGGQAGSAAGPYEWGLQFPDVVYSVRSVAADGYEVVVVKP
jgi:hypothetical protein